MNTFATQVLYKQKSTLAAAVVYEKSDSENSVDIDSSASPEFKT